MNIETIESTTDIIFNDLETIMEDDEIVVPLLAHLELGAPPITVNALCKVSGLSQTALTLKLVELAGRVGVKDGGLVRLPEPVVVEKTRTIGSRGPTAKVAPRLEICRETLLTLIEGGPVTAIDLLKVAEDRFKYTDILLVARTLLAEGTIMESRKGRKATWILPTA